MDENSPVHCFFSQSFLFDSFRFLSSVLSIFNCVADPSCSGSCHRLVSFLPFEAQWSLYILPALTH
jgi:hypothetical protein